MCHVPFLFAAMHQVDYDTDMHVGEITIRTAQ